MRAIDVQARIAGLVLHADLGVGGVDAAGDQQRCFEAPQDLAGLGLGQGGEALFDHCIELFLGPAFHQVLGARP